jgi:hypothetical protein
MRRVLLAGAAVLALAAAAPALAASDPTGDYLPTFVGDHDLDLDVTSFSVVFDDPADVFHLHATFAGDIDPAKAGLYVVGVNTGGAASPGPFASISNPNVIFNRVIVIQKTGAATLINGGPLTANVFDNAFTLDVPLALFGATTFQPLEFGWNLWPRNGLGNNNQISDFAPDNATMTASIPEPAAWALMIGGFAVAGGTLRRRNRRAAVPV